MRCFDEEGIFLALGHAADDADDFLGVGFFVAAELAEAGEDFVFGMLADAAGVEEDDVGLLVARDGCHAARLKLSLDELAVEDVHLAAECFEEVRPAIQRCTLHARLCWAA